MTIHSEAVAALKKVTKARMEARAYCVKVEEQLRKAQIEEQQANKDYHAVLDNLRANLELEIVQEMDDGEFLKSGVVQ